MTSGERQYILDTYKEYSKDDFLLAIIAQEDMLQMRVGNVFIGTTQREGWNMARDVITQCENTANYLRKAMMTHYPDMNQVGIEFQLNQLRKRRYTERVKREHERERKLKRKWLFF